MENSPVIFEHLCRRRFSWILCSFIQFHYVFILTSEVSCLSSEADYICVTQVWVKAVVLRTKQNHCPLASPPGVPLLPGLYFCYQKWSDLFKSIADRFLLISLLIQQLTKKVHVFHVSCKESEGLMDPGGFWSLFVFAFPDSQLRVWNIPAQSFSRKWEIPAKPGCSAFCGCPSLTFPEEKNPTCVLEIWKGYKERKKKKKHAVAKEKKKSIFLFCSGVKMTDVLSQ